VEEEEETAGDPTKMNESKPGTRKLSLGLACGLLSFFPNS